MADVLKTATNSDIETLKKRQKIKNTIISKNSLPILTVVSDLLFFLMQSRKTPQQMQRILFVLAKHRTSAGLFREFPRTESLIPESLSISAAHMPLCLKLQERKI